MAREVVKALQHMPGERARRVPIQVLAVQPVANRREQFPAYFGSETISKLAIYPSIAQSLTSPHIYAKNPSKPGRLPHELKLGRRRFQNGRSRSPPHPQDSRKQLASRDAGIPHL